MSNKNLTAKFRPFNTEFGLWMRFKREHPNQPLNVCDNKVNFSRYGTIAMFESHIAALQTLKYVGYSIILTEINRENNTLTDVLR